MPAHTVFDPVLSIFERADFPVEDCTQKCPREAGIYNGTRPYLCVIADGSNSMTLQVMYPYICKFSDLDEKLREQLLEDVPGMDKVNKGLTFAWNTKSGDYVDHVHFPVHDDKARVIGWMLCPEGA